MSKIKEDAEDAENAETNSPKLVNREQDILTLLGKCQPISKVARSVGVSPRAVDAILRSVKIALEANDSAVDDFYQIVENWEVDPTGPFMLNEKKSESVKKSGDHPDPYILRSANAAEEKPHQTKSKQDIIDEIESEWAPYEMRDLGASLIRLADAIDQDWDPAAVQASFHWPSAAAQIERNSIELSKKAVLLKRQIGMRKKFLPEAMLGEPTWNMLLELFCQFAGGAKVSSKSLCIAADCPESTALRYIDRLEETDLVERCRSDLDGRVTLVKLTKKGVVGVGRVLERISI